MSLSLSDERLFEIAKPYRLQWEKAQGNYVLLYPEGMVKLNDSAGLILDRCCKDQKTLGQVIAELAEEFEQSTAEIGPDVHDFLKVAYDNGWIRERA